MPPPRRTDPNVNVRNNLTASKVNKRPFNPRNGNNLAASAADSSLNRPGMIHSGILSGILLMIVLLVVFLLAHFETNRHLKEITQNIDKSRKDLLNLTQHLTTMSEDVRMGGQVRPIVHRIDHAQFTLGAKVIKLQGIELPMTGPTNEQVRNLLGISVPKTACNILGRYLDRKNFLVFKGDKAIITIRLHQPIFPDTIRIDHYIENLQDFKIVKAVPKDISVYGLQMKTSDLVALGNMRMNVNLHSKSQSGILHVKPTEAYEVYKIEILSNHGNKDLTRLYKVRIYGNVEQEVQPIN